MGSGGYPLLTDRKSAPPDAEALHNLVTGVVHGA